MNYTDEEIKYYLSFLNSDKQQDREDCDRRARCCYCQSDHFFVNSGYNICEECGASNGHTLGFYDQREYDRFHFRKKSIYQRKYHYEKKIAQVSKRLHLTEEQKYCLFKKLNGNRPTRHGNTKQTILSEKNDKHFLFNLEILRRNGK